MLSHHVVTGSKGMLLAGILASSILVSAVAAQSVAPAESVAPAPKPEAASAPYRNQPARVSKRATAIYESVWGIEAPSVKAVESGVILRFSYRVLDPEKAKPLHDKSVEPLLICMEKGVRLVVPSLEKIGMLRQAPRELEAGKSYWMAFSNSGRLLKRGDRVNIVVGNFRAEGLTVE